MTHLEFSLPGTTYLGTRFDRSGILAAARRGGNDYVGCWFDGSDPFRHDNVTGPAEEFSPIGYDDAAPGGTFLKIGVGLLQRETSDPYDWFHLYQVADPGERTFAESGGGAVFTHRLDGFYNYRKEILPTAEGFSIRHELRNLSPRELEGTVYCHNFFTLGDDSVGPQTSIHFPFRPAGEWRADSVAARLTEDGIAFERPLLPGEKAYMGCLHAAEGPNVYAFEKRDAATGQAVACRCDRPFHHIVFWSNHRIACVEPYLAYSILPGESFTWQLDYCLE